MKGKKIFYVDVELLNGRVYRYQLPNDLQEALLTYYQGNKDCWVELLEGALINVPSEKYTAKNNFEPIMRIGKVRRFYYKKHNQRWRTRGQFLIAENWQKSGVKHFWESLRFLQHDFKLQTKILQIVDYYRWRHRVKLIKKEKQ